jgi:purine-binding chemotaxis protein CheW
MAAKHPNAELYLICRSAGHLCALPLDKVREIMRPLPLEQVAATTADSAAAFVLGAAIVRGAVLPVLSLAALMGRRHIDDRAAFGRFVSLRLGLRHAVLAVEAVLGIRALEQTEATEAVAPLIGMVEHDAVAAITTHDAELLFVLQTAKLVPDAAWAGMETAP